MNQRELYRSIADACGGESVGRIARLGFLLAPPTDMIEDPHHEDLGPLVLDFDALDEEADDFACPTALDLLFS